MGLEGKNAVVTGGGTGIGRAVAAALAAEGARVAVAGRRGDKLKETASLATAGPAIIHRECDIADRASVADYFRWALAELGQVDILVNSAGINIRKRSLEEIDPAEWDRVLAINASGAFYCIKEVLPGMKQRRDGVIINVSSVAGKRAVLLGGVAYNASKFAMTALGTAASLELGEHGVRVTNIYPGEVNTPILDERPVPVSEEHRRRILQSEDVARAVVFVASLPPRAHVAEMVIKPTRQPYA